MKDYQIKPAVSSDHEKLTEIAIQSKRYWNYPEKWIQGWIDDLTITPDYIKTHSVYKLVKEPDNSIAGFCALEWNPEKKELEIAHLWLKPEFIGKKLGRYLLGSCLKKTDHLPVQKVTVTSDPNALGFYKRFGFNIKSYVESTPPGRLLPRLALELP